MRYPCRRLRCKAFNLGALRPKNPANNDTIGKNKPTQQDQAMSVSLEQIQKAASTLEGKVVRTPLIYSSTLSQMLDATIYIKHENLQPTHSFKVRGACVKMQALTPQQRDNGVVAMSAGNHAQAVAFHAREMGVSVSLVMPESTPAVKLLGCQEMGAEVVLSGETITEAQAAAEDIAHKQKKTLVHPYDDDDIIAGQGTIALEMLEDCPELDILIVPIGGGGLIGGVATAAKTLRPDIQIIGIEAESFPSMYAAINNTKAVCGGRTIGEGIAVKNVTPRTINIARKYVDDIMLVSETDMEDAIVAFLDLHKSIAEGAGAAGLAAVLAQPQRFAKRNIGIILCGGNIDPRVLNSVVSRKLARLQRIIRLHVEIMDQPGALASVATIISQTRGNILEVIHHRLLLDLPAKQASLDLMIETQGPQHATTIVNSLNSAGFPATHIYPKHARD